VHFFTFKVKKLWVTDFLKVGNLKIPEELKDKVVSGVSVLYWDILGEKIMKQLRSEG